MTQLEQLVASLQVGESSAYALGDNGGGPYFDWSCGDHDGGVSMEIGDETGEAVLIPMTVDQVAELQRRLTIWLINHQGGIQR
jgi:hypothetical protein